MPCGAFAETNGGSPYTFALDAPDSDPEGYAAETRILDHTSSDGLDVG